ncbi:MAG: hypothetical protein QOJ64_3853 [Acidobacteriota bacterium]|jgi:hypothetical protein|nr:hypothetical protein [Acidobacteriota bacterium]
MKRKGLIISSLLFLSAVTCLGQAPYMGLTAGKSTRVDIERTSGQPIRSASKTLIEYKPRRDVDQIFVQYRDESSEAIVDRIELICTGNEGLRCSKWHDATQGEYKINLTIPDASVTSHTTDGFLKSTDYIGSPFFIVWGRKYDSNPETRSWAFYSKELFEATVPQRGCTGAIFGDWDTDLGRMIITREGHGARDKEGYNTVLVRGRYESNNGTFTGKLPGSVFEWKDDTGTGTMVIDFDYEVADRFSGEWVRRTGTGPKKGKFSARCVKTAYDNH